MTAAEIVMIGLTAISAVGAVYAGVVSHKAESNASHANRAARAANDLSSESNTIARSARDDARNAVLDVAWDELIVAIAPLLTVMPHRDARHGEYLVAGRARSTILIDRLDGWEQFDEWVAAEWRLGSSLGREVMEGTARRMSQQAVAANGPMSIDEELAISDPLHTWAAGFNHNLRRFRLEGYNGETVAELLSHARKLTEDLYARHGWTLPPESLPGLAPLK